MVSTCVGLIGGALVSAAAGRALNSLVRIDGMDAQTLAIAAVVYLAIAAIATYIPARRAFTLDTVRALGSI